MLETYFRSGRVRSRMHKNILGGIVEELVVHFDQRKYSAHTIQVYLQAIEHFGVWLEMMGLPCSAVAEGSVQRFHSEHLPVCQCAPPSPRSLFNSRAALTHLLVVLRSTGRAVPAPAPNPSLIDEAVFVYEEYLQNVCGVAAATCLYRARYVRDFLRAQYGDGPVDVSSVCPGDVVDFVCSRGKGLKRGSIRVIACSLRSYLRFLQVVGLCERNLAAAVPSIREWKLASIPSTLTNQEVRGLLGSFDRSSPVGLRDYAMTMCMVELGLRADDVARLCLEDINWREAVIRISDGKSRRIRHLPLPQSLGEALADYLRAGRPGTQARSFFVRHSPPVGDPVKVGQVRGAINRAYRRVSTGLEWKGPHTLRHTAATGMHQGGASFKEIADVLGHQSIDTTAIYAKVNLPMLARVALPWPEVKP